MGGTNRKGRAKKVKPVSLAPGYDGQRQLVSETIVSPYARSVVLEPGETPRPQTETVRRNARHDPIEQLYHQRGPKGERILQWHQREAAMRVRQLTETLGLSALRAMNLENERVDGGGVLEGVTAAQIAAARAIKGLQGKLGEDYYAVVLRVAGFGEAVSIVARDFEEVEGVGGAGFTLRTRDFVSKVLRRSLDLTAVFFGLAVDEGRLRRRRLGVWADSDVGTDIAESRSKRMRAG